MSISFVIQLTFQNEELENKYQKYPRANFQIFLVDKNEFNESKYVITITKVYFLFRFITVLILNMKQMLK